MSPAAKSAKSATAGRGDRTLRALAERAGIVAEYMDQTGREKRVTADETRTAILAAMGVDTSSAAAARAALERAADEVAHRVLAPTRVVRRSDLARALDLHGGAQGAREWSAALAMEDGAHHAADGRLRAGQGARLPAAPAAIPVGYHRLTVRVVGRDGEREARQRLIVVPDRCPDPARILRGQRVFGVTANLYAVRSARNWGAGDVTDLRHLLEWSAEQGAAFVGVNPLHALRNDGNDVSPYSPVSRLFRNVLYLDVDAVPELAESPEARELLAATGTVAAIGKLRARDAVDYEGVMAAKRPVLEALYAAFVAAHGAGRTTRGAAYRAWLGQQGEALDRFATWAAIDETVAREAGGQARYDWRHWPEGLRRPDTDETRRFQARESSRIDFHRWLQFELDRQLGVVAARGAAAGMPIGLYQDLAIGTSRTGSDTWAHPGLFLDGVSVGAPPDPLALEGQNWGLPPLDPVRLAADGYQYWARLLGAAFRHAGALRIDHVIGLFRQFWIPDGMSGDRGAYVRFPADDLLGILALEAERANALVVGEDLGTVPPEVGPALGRWGVLGSKVLYFERGEGGSFRPAREYARMALTTANTHDMASLAAFWTGRDVALRAEQGLTNARATAQAKRDRAVDREQLVKRLVDEGLLPEDTTDVDDLALRAAAHAFLRRTPSWLVGLSLDDLLGETEPVNLPGVDLAKWPMWRVRQRSPLERLRDDPAPRRALGAERVWVP